MTTSRFALLLPCAALAAVLGCGAMDDVKVAVTGPGRVRSNPAGLVCSEAGGVCSAELGRSFTLTAEADTGAKLDHWEGDAICVSQNRQTIVVSLAPTGKLDCTAVFVDATTPAPTAAQ